MIYNTCVGAGDRHNIFLQPEGSTVNGGKGLFLLVFVKFRFLLFQILTLNQSRLFAWGFLLKMCLHILIKRTGKGAARTSCGQLGSAADLHMHIINEGKGKCFPTKASLPLFGILWGTV